MTERGRPLAPSTAHSGVPGSALLGALQSPQSFAVGRKTLLLNQFSLLIDLYATPLVALWGSTPITISACRLATSFALGSTAILRTEDNPTLGEIPTPLP